MNYHSLLLNIDELLLKGQNKGLFMEKLRNHLFHVLRTYHEGKIKTLKDHRRQIIESDVLFAESTLQRLLAIPGLHSIHLGRRIPLDFQQLFPAVMEELKGLTTLPRTFKVHTKRSYKSFPMDSMSISRQLGHMILQAHPELKVDVHRPELTITVKVMEQGFFLSIKRLEGIGGLPVGSSGHLLTLLSGGFDSPVASYLMSKRGCQQSFVFFHAYPYVGHEVKEKIINLSKVLAQYQYLPKLYIIPFGKIQKIISDHCRESYRTIFFRKYMVDCSTQLAHRLGAQGMITGDSIGQVSSQTLQNISLMNHSTSLPIFRPLIGFNKIEIINLAKKVGTHDISILPHDDACSLFAAKHPVTNPHKDYFHHFTHTWPLSEEIQECLDTMEIYSLTAEKAEKIPSSFKGAHKDALFDHLGII